MQAVAVDTIDMVNSGGILRDSLQDFVFIEGKRVVTVGWIGDSHPPCSSDQPQHCQGNWHITAGSSLTFIEGIPIARLGDSASCGHNITTGSDFVSSD